MEVMKLSCGSGLHRFEEEQEALLNDDLGFTFDGEGNLVQDTVEHPAEQTPRAMPNDVSRGHRESSLLAHVRQEHEAGPEIGANVSSLTFNQALNDFLTLRILYLKLTLHSSTMM